MIAKSAAENRAQYVDESSNHHRWMIHQTSYFDEEIGAAAVEPSTSLFASSALALFYVNWNAW